MMCRVLRVSRSGYYAWAGRSESHRAGADRELVMKIRTCHIESRGTYGSPRMCDELRRRGERCGENRVARLMRAHGIVGLPKRRWRSTTDSEHGQPVAPNILNRQFAAEAPNRAWVSDLTCVWTREGWMYVATVMDLYSRRVVGLATGASADHWLVGRALQMAISRRRPGPGLIFHSDQGRQYTASEIQKLLSRHQIVASMSRRGNCWDNAPAERLFATLKTELVRRRQYRTRDQATREVCEYFEHFYNQRRSHSALGYLSPAAFEARAQTH